MSGVIGKFIESPSHLHGEWHISNFLSLPKEVDTMYQSPEFLFSDAVWQLKMYPNGLINLNTEGYIGLYILRRNSGLPKSISYRFGIRNINDTEESSVIMPRRVLFSETNIAQGVAKFLKLSDLLSKPDMLPSGTLIVKCELVNHSKLYTQGTFFRRLRNMSLSMSDILAKRNRTDIVLKLKDGEIPAHKMIMEARSTVFNRMFDADMRETKTGEVNVEDSDKDTFMVVLSFTYSGDPKGLCSENVYEVYKAAHKYDLQELKELCAELMEDCLSVDTVCDIITIADLYQEENLKECAKDYFAEHKKEVFKTKKWKALRRENPAIGCEVLECVFGGEYD